jgi:hypothetical protein
MNRFRFYVPGQDGSPIGFPPEGPFWITGYSDTHVVVVAYSPDLATLTREDRWPDAENIDDGGPQPLSFSGRFPKPEWWKGLE